MLRRILSNIVIIICFLALNASAQNGNPLQFLEKVSQASITNPAHKNHTEQLVVGLPMLSGMNLEWNANFSFDYVFAENFDYSFRKFYDNLEGPGEAFLTSRIPILYLSKTTGKHTYSFSISENLIGLTRFDRGLAQFIDNGVKPYYNAPAEEFGPAAFHSSHYKEVALGFSTEIVKGLRVGIRPKLIIGRLYYDLPQVTVQVSTDNANREVLVKPNGTYIAAAPVTLYEDPEFHYTSLKSEPKLGDYFFNFKNISPGVDVGISAQITENTKASVSVTNIGYFTLKGPVFAMTYSRPVRYSEPLQYQSSDPEGEDYLEAKEALSLFSDSIPFIITGEPLDMNIKENLPLNVFVSASHQFYNESRVGVRGQMTSYHEQSENYITAYYHSSTDRPFNWVATVSMHNMKDILPGVGISYTGNYLQYYLATNNILKLVQPASAKNINLSFGINFLFSTE